MIQKLNLRDQVLEHLVKEIIKGSIKEGNTVSLAALARSLEVSVTPIREALNQLSRVGVIEAIPNRGFILKPLNIEEALEIYPIISKLEVLAIEHAQYSSKDIKQLKLKNEQFSKASNIHQAVINDEQFHQCLIHPYRNITLNRLINDLKIRILMYELRFQDDKSLLQQSVEEHQKLIDSLKEMNIELAKSILIDHWKQSMLFIKNKMQK